MEEVTQILTTFSSWAVSLTAIIALLTAVCKPLREHLQKRVAGKQSEMVKNVEDIKRDVEGIRKDVDGIKVSMSELDEKHKELTAKNDINERDRLREVIFRFGNIARRGERISSEEFRHLQEVFAKYRSLGGNSIAKEEFDFIQQYYNENAIKWL